MHFVGKMLVVLQLILSVVFMAFAGVVYHHQISWRAEALKQKDAVVASNKKLSDKEEEFDKFKTAMDAKVKLAEGNAAVLQVNNRGLQAELAISKKENGDLLSSQKTSSEQSLIANVEATARTEEAENLRKIVKDLAMTRDAEFAVRLKLEDQLHSLQLDLDTAKTKNRDLLGKYSLAMRALEAAGITADVNELAARNSPPPVVEGKVQDIDKPKRQGAAELVEISLGSDMGLKNGHQLTVYRSGAQPKYLAKIVIKRTYPDKSVGEVIESSRNGVIQKGDNVSTKL